jgi:hypothetical protein
VLSGRGLCDGLITRLEESYRLWRVVVCDQETSKTRRLKARYRAVKIQAQWVVTPGKQTNMYGIYFKLGRYSSVGIATRYGLDGPGIESRLGRDFPHPSRPALWQTQPTIQWVPGLLYYTVGTGSPVLYNGYRVSCTIKWVPGLLYSPLGLRGLL